VCSFELELGITDWPGWSEVADGSKTACFRHGMAERPRNAEMKRRGAKRKKTK
jgi:hypothetical protein